MESHVGSKQELEEIVCSQVKDLSHTLEVLERQAEEQDAQTCSIALLRSQLDAFGSRLVSTERTILHHMNRLNESANPASKSGRNELEYFSSGRLNSLLMRLSQVYATLRSKSESEGVGCDDEEGKGEGRSGSGVAGGEETPESNHVDGGRITRQTFKFKVEAADILELQVMVMRHLPLVPPLSLTTTHSSADPVGLGMWTGTHSVYLEDDRLTTYHTRLARHHAAFLFRCRWYSTPTPTPDQEVYIERKTHNDSWTGMESVKERASLSWGELPATIGLAPPASPSKAKSCKLVTSFRDTIQENNLIPAVSTRYWRVAFQSKSKSSSAPQNGGGGKAAFDLGTRVTLDTAIHFHLKQEEGTITGSSSLLRSLPSFPNIDGRVLGSAILEVKVYEGQGLPEWVRQLEEPRGERGPLIQSTPKFSKFLHACAVLYSPASVPPWMDLFTSKPLPNNGSRPPARLPPLHASNDTIPQEKALPAGPNGEDNSPDHCSINIRANNQLKNEDITPVKSRRRMRAWLKAHSPAAIMSRKRAATGLVRVEPKTFFANERTLLQWLNMVVFLALLAVSLFTQSDIREVRYLGVVVTIVAVGLALYSYYTYWSRGRALTLRRYSARYDDTLGPAMLVPCLVAVLVLLAVLSIKDLNNHDSDTDTGVSIYV